MVYCRCGSHPNRRLSHLQQDLAALCAPDMFPVSLARHLPFPNLGPPPPPLISAAFLAAFRPSPPPSLCTLDTTFSNVAGCRCCCVLSEGGEGGGRCTLTITLMYIAMRNTTGNTQHHYASGARDDGSMLAAYVWLRINRYTRAHRHVSTCAIRSTPAINPLSPYP